MSDTESTNQDEIGPPDEGSYEFYDRTPSPSSTSSSSVDARINDMFDEDEMDGYLDTSTHHFPGRFSFEDPIAPSFRLPGDLIASTMNGDVALDGMLSVSLDSDAELKKQNIFFLEKSHTHPSDCVLSHCSWGQEFLVWFSFFGQESGGVCLCHCWTLVGHPL